MALVQNDYKDWAIINKKGETLYKLDNITRLALGTNDYSPKRIEIIKQLVNYNILAIEDFRGKKSLINKNGKELLLNKKFRISKFIDNLAVVNFYDSNLKKSTSGIINNLGEILFLIKNNKF